MASLTAAHPTLPMPCYARVTNLGNGKSLIVRVNDRGPYHGNRLIDVSNKAAELLEFKGNGVARVRVEYVARAPLEGSDDRQLMATLRTGETFISTIAEVTFYGHDQAGNELSVTGTIGITFGNFADPS